MIDQNVAEFEKMNINKWHSYGWKGKGANIVVLDTSGKPHEHTNVIEPIPSGYTGIGHQTNVCSVVREIAPEATIYSFHWTSGFKDEILAWIEEHKGIIDVINFSVSGLRVADEFKELSKFDIPIVVATGNDSYTDKLNPYAELEWTIAVNAWEEHRDSMASYGNYGEGVDLVAYTSIYIPSSDGYSRTFMFRGTSCSAPVVSGIIGIYDGFLKESGFPSLSRDEALEFLKEHSLDKLDEGYDIMSGHGLARLPEDIPTIEVIEEPIEEQKEEDSVADFKDMQGHWAEEYVDFVVEKEIMNGFPDGTFQPNKVMTRAEVATVIARMLGFVPVKK